MERRDSGRTLATVAAPARPARLEQEYHRKGEWVYLAACDVRRAKIFAPCAPRNGIPPFDGLLAGDGARGLGFGPTRILDHGEWLRARGQKCVQRLRARWPSMVPLHTPNPASRRNQVEIYFSLVQRKVLTPNDFPSLAWKDLD